MSSKLVAYFSATGMTRAVATLLADFTGADLRAIRPTVPYTRADLDWRDGHSRSSLEMDGVLPWAGMEGAPWDLRGYDVVFVGFPIWWYTAPTIIRTFLSSCDFTGKTVHLFATSGGSGFGRTSEYLRPLLAADAVLREGIVLQDVNGSELMAWLSTIDVLPGLWGGAPAGLLGALSG